MPSLDTNILLRLVLRDNEAMLYATKKLLAKHDVFAVADQAIIELEYTLCGYYKYTREEFAQIIEKLFFANQHLNLNRPLFEKVLPYYLKHRSVSIDDCCLAVYAKLNDQIPLYTFDKKFARDIPHVELVPTL